MLVIMATGFNKDPPRQVWSISPPLQMPIRFSFGHTFEIFLANFLVDFALVIVKNEIWSEN